MSAAAALSEMGNDRIAMGANRSPEQVVFDELDLLYNEAKLWADGKGTEAIASNDLEPVKEALDTLDQALLKTGQEAEAMRVAQKKPHDLAAKAVQDRFNPYVQKDKGKVDMARVALNKVRAAVNQKVLDDKTAAAAKAQADADAEIAEFKAARENHDGSLESAEQLQQLEASVGMAQKVAKTAVKEATTKTGLKPVYRAEITNFKEAAQYYWGPEHAEFEALVLQFAQRDVNAGKHVIPGITVHTDMKAR